MATGSIKLRAKERNGETDVKALISHEMETGLRKDKNTGELIPARFIQEVIAEVNGKVVLSAYWGNTVSKNPYLSFKLKNAKAGDQIKLSWTDNQGDTDSVTDTIN